MADWKKVASSQALNVGLSAVSVGADIAGGKGVVKSVASGALDFAKWEIISGLIGTPAMWAYTAYQVGSVATNALIENGRGKADKTNRNTTGTGKVGNGFYDNDYSATMRQRGLEAIGGHQGITNNALGSEARRRASNIRY